ncbi:hypothetical protein MHYP_G00008640 [Metynnis hypsauchen]
MEKSVGEDYWTKETQKAQGAQETFTVSVGPIMRCFSQTEGDSDMEIVDSADHSAASQNHNAPNEIGALVEVTFQRNPHQEQKYLEAEPKALGLTQIMLSLFVMSTATVVIYINVVNTILHFITCSLSSLLKACLVMQILTCAVSVVCFIISLGLTVNMHMIYSCWDYNHWNSSEQEFCEEMTGAYTHLGGLEMLCQAAQVAISATLAAFCCKVIQCCSPRTSVPMIVVNARTAPQ